MTQLPSTQLNQGQRAVRNMMLLTGMNGWPIELYEFVQTKMTEVNEGNVDLPEVVAEWVLNTPNPLLLIALRSEKQKSQGRMLYLIVSIIGTVTCSTDYFFVHLLSPTTSLVWTAAFVLLLLVTISRFFTRTARLARRARRLKLV